ncbi:related to ribosomal protein L30 [Cephalotrichum gorgonifer]|uniref:Large ribosomal subunit protein uL30m n=1 Tax=Cephalotrichum gorgonifer TaxID=2041049 RepID=A0AAE8SW31_9PEZI|nr:related to ribosomal protein L30 [Cephalotrichum gorgonifer]
MSYFRVTLHRSAIGLPKRTTGVLAALGLRRRSQVVFHPVEAQFAGMIMKVKELVRVEEVDRILTKRQVTASRRPDRGFEVLGNRGSYRGWLALISQTPTWRRQPKELQ